MRTVSLCLFILCISNACTSLKPETKLVPLAEGWANNSVNTVIFRHNSLVSYHDTQFAAFYDSEQYLVLAKRKLGSANWIIKRTPYKGRAVDAHNSISIMADGDGYLHVAWDHHGDPLRYAKSTHPESLELTEKISMTGMKEDHVTYPEFYRMPDGNLLFFYRSGGSGNGDLVMNSYDLQSGKWKQIQSNLINGQGQRNAYWQACVDTHGNLHISWVWRESGDVATNHDISYARSKDGGKTWENSKGEKYVLPINIDNAEIVWHIPQNSELINQTAMTADSKGNPVIATYWREKKSKIPQYQVVYNNGQLWKADQISSRETPFSLSGGGTKRIPISRPQIMLRKKNGVEQAFLIFRDAERKEKVSVAISKNFPEGKWKVKNLTEESVGAWEPSYDTELWKTHGFLNLFVQKVEQIDGEGLVDKKPEQIYILEWDPKLN